MHEYASALAACPLFSGIAPEEMDAMLACLGARTRRYKKGAAIFRVGTPAEYVGVILSGGADVTQVDFWGNQTLLARLGASDLFGEAFVCAGAEALPVTVTTAEDAAILLLDYGRVLTTCEGTCAFHSRLIGNMVRVLARKNIALTQNIERLSRRTTREKALSYLTQEAARAGSAAFDIPLNRQELADALAVDRSALSAELGRMQRDGLLSFHKNHFTLLPQESAQKSSR